MSLDLFDFILGMFIGFVLGRAYVPVANLWKDFFKFKLQENKKIK